MKSALKITLIYLFIGILWIVLSDITVDILFGSSSSEEAYVQIIKGIFYVCATGILLYFLINRYQKKLEEKVKELKRLNENLESEKENIKKSNEELEHFADIASHDLKSPLRTISTLIQRFRVKFKENLNEDSEKYLEIIEDSSKKLNEKIVETLRFSKVHHYKQEQEVVDLNEMLESIKNNIRTVIDEKNAQIKYANLPIIKSSKNLLYQVFQNLIDNAIKYSKPDESPIIEVYCESQKKHWQFCVRDNGIGIDKEYQKLIFDKYYRVDNKNQIDGDGIGLSIVKEIVEKLGGEIWVESDIGEGACIYFTLPKN